MLQEEIKIRLSEQKGYTLEDVMLSEFMDWVKMRYPRLRHKIFHIGNEGNRGGKRGLLDGMKALSKGKLAGVPDVCLLWMGQVHWIEFKLPNGKLSDTQSALHELWKEDGQNVWIVKNFEQFKSIIEHVLKVPISGGC